VSIFFDHPELLRPFRDGERPALERVYFGYVDVVGAIVRRGVSFSSGAHVAGTTHADGADLIQETFVRAFEERARLAYDGLRPYRPYLLTICRNLMASWASQRGRTLPSGHGDDLLGDAPVQDQVEELDPATLALIERYVASLPQQLRNVYEQRYEKDASQEEAARALGLTRQKVRTLEDKLRAGLAKALAQA
jgi:RNA polymerase sigma-70 factor (ECF subfamily)